MGSSVITPEDVLETLMNDGSIDAIRLKIINQLKAIEELKNKTITMVEQSRVLKTPGAERQTKRELFDTLRRELETPVLEKASKSVWEIILDSEGLGKEISETVEKVFCRLSGRYLPLFPMPGGDTPRTEMEKEDMEKEADKYTDREEKDKDKDKESLGSSSKKRNYSEMSIQGVGKVANGNADPPSAPEESGTLILQMQRYEAKKIFDSEIVQKIASASVAEPPYMKNSTIAFRQLPGRPSVF